MLPELRGHSLGQSCPGSRSPWRCQRDRGTFPRGQQGVRITQQHPVRGGSHPDPGTAPRRGPAAPLGLFGSSAQFRFRNPAGHSPCSGGTLCPVLPKNHRRPFLGCAGAAAGARAGREGSSGTGKYSFIPKTEGIRAPARSSGVSRCLWRSISRCRCGSAGPRGCLAEVAVP